jgi:Tfp pilus assembly protein PilE
MAMIFCRGCGKEIHESAPTCPHCGAPQVVATPYDASNIPPGVAGWSWGAFLLNWIWAIGNRTWIGLLVLVPFVGWIMSFVLGFKGREWAWKNKQWDSLEHFNEVQKKWSFWGVLITLIFIPIFVIGILAAVAIPAYQDYVKKGEAAKQSQEAQHETPLVASQNAQAASGNWSAVTKIAFVNSCTNSAIQAGATSEYATNFCNCAADKAERVIPEDKLGTAENTDLIGSLAAQCKN